MNITEFCRRLALGTAAACLLAGGALADDNPPTPTPTPTVRAKTLGDVAKNVRLKGQDSKPAEGDKKGIVITNENLPEYADKGLVTSAKPAAPEPSGAVGVAPESAGPPSDKDAKREYWRARYKEQLDTVASIEAEIESLDKLIPKLWNDFYSWDDPAYRDGVIKPKLDEALLRRQALEEKLAEEKPKVDKVLDEARRDGALPGWFRDLYPK